MNFHKQKTQWLFPVPVWPFGFPDCEEVNRRAEQRIYELASEKESWRASNEGGWHSTNLTQDEAMAPIIEFIGWAIREVAEESSIEFKDYDLSLWANLNRPHDYNVTHSHPGFHLSGVYYVKLPEGDCGNIRLYNPMFSYEYCSRTAGPPYQQHRVELKGKEGALLIFRSPLLHDVGRNNTDGDRISLAFNARFIR